MDAGACTRSTHVRVRGAPVNTHTYDCILTSISYSTGEVMRGHRSPPILPHTPLAHVVLTLSQLVSQSARVRATGS